MMATETKAFDVAEYLDSPEMIAAYLDAAIEENDDGFTAKAIGEVARAMGMSALARNTGLSREALYKALGDDGNPTLDTLKKVFKAMGLRLSVVPEKQFA